MSVPWLDDSLGIFVKSLFSDFYKKKKKAFIWSFPGEVYFLQLFLIEFVEQRVPATLA